MYANNPLHVGLPFVIGTHDDALKIPTEKVRVFSIGNGFTNFHIKEDSEGESGNIGKIKGVKHFRLGVDSMGTSDDKVVV